MANSNIKDILNGHVIEAKGKDGQAKTINGAVLVRLENQDVALLLASTLVGKSREERDAELAKLVPGTPVRVMVTEIGEKDGKERIKVSVYAVIAAERKAKAEARKAAIGALVANETVLEGPVTKVLPEVGALVQVNPDVQGLDGLVHFSQLTGGKERLSTIAVGDSLTVKVLKVEETEKDGRKQTKISLSEKALVQAERSASLEEGQVVGGTVVKTLPDGLKIDLGKGLEGFLSFEDLAGTSREALTKQRHQRVRVAFVRMDGDVAVVTREGVRK